MHRKIVLSLVMALILAVPFLSNSRMVLADTTWVTTATQSTPVMQFAADGKTYVPALDTGALAGSTPLNLVVSLRVRNPDGLKQFVRDVTTPGDPVYGKYLTPSQFNSLYSPTPDAINAVTGYLTSKGFTDIQTAPNGLLVTAGATAAQAEAAFNTQIHQFVVNGTTKYANIAPAQVPASLGTTVLSVLGLNNTAVMHLQARAHQAVPPNPTSFGAQDFQKVYDAGNTHAGTLTNTAIFAVGDLTGVVANNPGGVNDGTDLAQYEKHFNLPYEPVTIVQVGLLGPANSSYNVEWDMDTQTSTGIAGGMQHLYVYDTPSLSDPAIATGFNRFVTDNVARALSASFGGCEYQSYLDGGLQADDQILQQGAAQGQTVFASSGDTGGFCPVGVPNGVPAGAPFVNYPAASPWVVAVGGTTVEPNADNSYNMETAWPAGGGGPSYFEYQPPWQVGVTPPIQANCAAAVVSCYGKGLPDVAMDADAILSGGQFYNAGTMTTNGGTSLASPLTLGVWARIMSSNGNKFGFAAPYLYGLYKAPIGTPPAVPASYPFHDIIVGNNGPYPATPGWDYATGLGSFDIARVSAALATAANPGPVQQPSLPLPVCTVGADASPNDAAPTGAQSPVQALDIRAIGFKTTTDSKGKPVDLVGQMKVQSLSAGTGGLPDFAGGGDKWDVQWYYTDPTTKVTTQYYLEASYPGGPPDPSNPAIPVTFTYGHITVTPANTAHTPDGIATGDLNQTTNIITIEAPLSALGNPAAGALLKSSYGQTRDSAGAVGFVADTLNGADYQVGHVCTSLSATATHVARASVRRQGGTLTFHWTARTSPDVIGFALYAGTHRLNHDLVPVHAASRYSYRVRWNGSGPYRLHVMLRNGGALTTTIR